MTEANMIDYLILIGIVYQQLIPIQINFRTGLNEAEKQFEKYLLTVSNNFLKSHFTQILQEKVRNLSRVG